MDRDLLFGILALDQAVITREQFVAAVKVRVADTSKSLSRILFDQGVLGEDARARLETLVQEHLQAHGNDAGRSLAAIDSIESVQEELRQLGDAEIGAVLDRVHVLRDGHDETLIMPPDTPVSASLRFRILRPHAQGGLAQVSVAWDEELRREVAFKELLQRHADDPEYRSRLVLEAKVTASLEHPGIVPVYGFGQYADGRPFYAMRFIRGDNLEQVIKRFHGLDVSGHDPRERALEFRRLLGRFIDVCNVVQYAHSRGVLHRDLKPSNVMMGKYGETLVVDWGIARTVDCPETEKDSPEATARFIAASAYVPTLAGRVLGTPPYMSPEQAEGRLDRLSPLTDVYGLGATLYCLLTGRTPFEDGNVVALLDKIKRGDLRRPGSVKSQVPSALEDICLKAMALKPEDRYASPAALAEELEHWLADEAVSAHRERVLARVGRWMRHHRTFALVGISALVMVATVSTVAAVIVNQARQRAQSFATANRLLADQERAARHDAMVHFRQARSAVDTWLTGVSEALRHYTGVQEARKRLLQRAAEEYQRFAAQRSGDMDLEVERGRAFLRLGEVRHELGELAEAEKAYLAAGSHFAALSEQHPEILDCPLEWANSRVKLALVWVDLGRDTEADQAYRSAISRLVSLAKAHPDDPRVGDSLAASLLNRAVLLTKIGSREEAETALQESVSQYESLVGPHAEVQRYRAGLATARSALADLLTHVGRDGEALTQLTQAVSEFDALKRLDPRNFEYVESRASAQIRLAGILRKMGRFAEEIDAYQKAIADYQDLNKQFPDVPLHRENLAMTWTDLGQLLVETGRAAEAKTELDRALPVFTELVVGYPLVPRYREQQAACRDVLGQALADLGRNREAKSALEQAAATCQELAAGFPDIPAYRQRKAVTQSHLATVLFKLGDHATAREAYQAAAQGLEELNRLDSKVASYRNATAFVCSYWGAMLYDLGEAQEAEKLFRRARELWETLAADPGSPEYCHNLAWLLVDCPDPKLRDAKQAVEWAKRAREKAPKNPRYTCTLGAAFHRAADDKAALETLNEAIRLSPHDDARNWFFLAMVQEQLRDPQTALKSYQSACQAMAKHGPDNLELKRLRKETGLLLGVPQERIPLKQ
jgi:tetratricopeptide (TPR) repeat protein/tRNA A-37 threonylcarbamoyl transferase component Bud32